MRATAQQPQRAPDGARVHYERHRPEQSTQYRLVQQHAASFIAHIEASAREEHPTVARVQVSGGDDPHLPAHARRAGLMSHLPKSLEPALWELALARILSGEPWSPREPAAAEAGPTGRQAVILVRLAEGRTNTAIASKLGIIERMVKHHLAEIYGRLGAANRAEAVARASKRGWIRLPQPP